MGGFFTNTPGLATTIFRSSEFEEETTDEEGLRAALIGPNKAETVEVLTGVTVSAFSAFLQYAPVLELVDRRDLHSRDRQGRPGSIPGWGTFFTPFGNLVHIILR
jgi:hypothetical protein